MSSSAMEIPHESGLPPRAKTIQEAYFEFLYDKVFDVWDNNSPDSFVVVAAFMHQIEFQALVPYDENRIADAAGLRNEFQRWAGSMGPEELNDLMLPNASIFEVLIALADKADHMVTLGGIRIWFRVFIENLGLDKYNDLYCQTRATFPIERALIRFNNRQYSPSGRGGIFPLRQPEEDQRQVELWYQMGAYMKDKAMY